MEVGAYGEILIKKNRLVEILKKKIRLVEFLCWRWEILLKKKWFGGNL